jgi:hypothetical protein
MISTWIGIAAIAALLVWLLGIGKRQDAREQQPEDDVETPIDHAELDAAEREIRDDPDAKAAADAVDDSDDDWGPGSGHSPIPGVK